jgi:hypothetical protein
VLKASPKGAFERVQYSAVAAVALRFEAGLRLCSYSRRYGMLMRTEPILHTAELRLIYHLFFNYFRTFLGVLTKLFWNCCVPSQKVFAFECFEAENLQAIQHNMI